MTGHRLHHLLGRLLLIALLAFGWPLHAAAAEDCLSGFGHAAAESCPPAVYGHQHRSRHSDPSVCRTLCNTVAALPDQSPRARPVARRLVRFFPAPVAALRGAGITPQPFPPRTGALG